MTQRRRPGQVRDAILEALRAHPVATLREIRSAVSEQLGYVPDSSVRSYLRLNTPGTFERVGRGKYRLRGRK